MDTETMSRLIAAAPSDVQSHLLALPDAQRLQIMQEAAHHFNSTTTATTNHSLTAESKLDKNIQSLYKEMRRLLKEQKQQEEKNKTTSTSKETDNVISSSLAALVQQHVVCTHCQTKPTVLGSLKRCGSCKAVHYCSTDCQRQDWSKGTTFRVTKTVSPPHKTICSSLASYMDRAKIIAETLQQTYPSSAITANFTLDDLYLHHVKKTFHHFFGF